jgi:hypothetical protein
MATPLFWPYKTHLMAASNPNQGFFFPLAITQKLFYL